jgi:ChpA-C
MKHFLLCFIAVALFVSGAQAQTCSNAALNGKYAIGGHGKNFVLDVLGVVTDSQHVEEVGFVVADGSGNISAATIHKEVESQMTTATYTGSYSLNSNCQGSLALTDTANPSDSPTFNIQVDSFLNTNNSTVRQFSAVETDGNAEVGLGASRSQDPVGGCTQSILAGVTMGDSGEGGTGNQEATAVFETTFNADSTVVGSGTESSDGVKSPLTINGTYTVNSDCSVTINQAGIEPGILQLIIVPVTQGATAMQAGVRPLASGAQGAAVGSPGVVSGTVTQIPVTVPINVCGNSIAIIGNAASGCVGG